LGGIYHTNREYAHELGDPLRTVAEAPNLQVDRGFLMGFISGMQDSFCHRLVPRPKTFLLSRDVIFQEEMPLLLWNNRYRFFI
jgi:hypothetical protein